MQEPSSQDALPEPLRGVDGGCVQLFLIPDLQDDAEGLCEGPATPWQPLRRFQWSTPRQWRIGADILYISLLLILKMMSDFNLACWLLRNHVLFIALCGVESGKFAKCGVATKGGWPLMGGGRYSRQHLAGHYNSPLV